MAPTMPQGDHEFRVASLFTTRLWYTTLPELTDIRSALVEDVLALLPHNATRPRRTAHVLHERREEHWKAFFRSLEGFINGVREAAGIPHRRSEVASWAIAFFGPEDYDEPEDMRHCHFSSTLSSLCWLQLPSELDDTEEGGTLFFDPLGFARSQYGPVKAYVAPEELGLIVFPSYLEHRPVAPSVDQWTQPRLAIASNHHFW